jgi:hypothetical protein
LERGHGVTSGVGLPMGAENVRDLHKRTGWLSNHG